MEAKDQRKTQSPGSESHGVHVCNKCGWQYPNPHPSAKHRRAHKKICGTIKGYELIDPEQATEVQGSDDEHKTPSPELVGKDESKLGGIGAISSRSEQEVFEDAACEFSGSPLSLRSYSSKENEELATMDVEKITKNPDEIHQSNSSSSACETRNPGVSDSCEVSSKDVLENQDPAPSSAEIPASRQRDDKSSAEGTSHTVTSETMIGSSQVAQVIGASDTVEDVGFETDGKGNGNAFPEGNSRDGLPSDLASAVGKRGDASDPMWNDDVIYSEVEGPDEFALEKSVIIESTEEEIIGNEKVPIDTSVVEANAAQEIAPGESAVSSQHGLEIMADKDDEVLLSVPDDIPFVENVEVSLHGFKGHKEMKLNQSANASLHETSKKEEYETDTANLAETLSIQSGQLSISKEVPSSDMLLLEDKNEQQVQDNWVVAEELHIKEHVVVSKIDNAEGDQPEESIASEDIEIKAGKVEATDSPSDTAQITCVSKTSRMPVSADTLVVESTADVNHTAHSIHTDDSAGYETELIQANDEAGESSIKNINEGNRTESELSSEPSGVAESHVSSLPDAVRGDDVIDHWTDSRDFTGKNSDAEVCASNSEGRTESSREVGEEENIPVEITKTPEEAISHSGSTVTASDAVKTSDQKLPKSERTDFHKILGGLGVIQGNDINSNDKTQECFAEVPVTIESNDHRDFGRLKNLSEAHISSLVPSLLATSNISNASETVDVIKHQPAKSEENANSVRPENNISAGDVALHSSNRCDSLEATWGSVSVLSDTPGSVNTELKKSNMKPFIDAPTRNDAEKSQKFVPPFLDRPTGNKYCGAEGADSEINKPENPSQPSSDAAALSKHQDIIERITNWSTEKQQQHVPLKNLLSEARSPQPDAVDNKNYNSSGAIPRVSSILGPETSPDSCFPAKGEVSEEWKTPARYPVDMKREERKAKNRPFWVPFVCCSSVN